MDQRASRVRSGPLLASLAALALAASAWLHWPRFDPREAPPRPPLRALLVDLSASVTRRRPAHAQWLRAQLLTATRAAARAGEELCLVHCAADVLLVQGPASASAFEAKLLGLESERWSPALGLGGDAASSLCAAMELARAELCASGRDRGRLEIFADGLASDGELSSLAAAFAARGLRVRLHGLPQAELPDLALEALRLPRELEEGAALAVGCELAFAAGSADAAAVTEVELEITLTMGPSVQVFVQPSTPPAEALQAADGFVRWGVRIDCGVLASGSWRCDAQARLRTATAAQGDPLPENDGASATVDIGGTLRVAVVAASLERGVGPSWYTKLAENPGFSFQQVEAKDLVSALAHADLLLTSDVGPSQLPGSAVAGFVRAGGGWLALDGWQALAEGGMVRDLSASAAAELLPFESELDDQADRDVVVLVDGSGSMQGAPFELVRAAVHELILAAPPRDRIELRFFRDKLEAPTLESPRGQDPQERAAFAAALFALRVPGGSTAVLPCLEELAQVRARATVPALVLLLSDGRSGAVEHLRARALREALARVRVELRVIGIGAEPDEAYLESLLLPGEALVRPDAEQGLGFLLRREVHASRVCADAALRAVLEPLADSTAPELVRALRESFASAFAVPHALERLELARLAPGAHAIWGASNGLPLLALQAVGRGWVAACTSGADPQWAPFLSADPALLWPLLSALARGRRHGTFPEILVQADELLLTHVPKDWPPCLELRFHEASSGFRNTGPGLELARANLFPPARGFGEDPRNLRVGQVPRLLLNLPRRSACEAEVFGPAGALAVLPLSLPHGPDFRPRAALGPLEWEASTSWQSHAAMGAHPLAVPLLGLALALLFLSALLVWRGDQGPASIRRKGNARATP